MRFTSPIKTFRHMNTIRKLYLVHPCQLTMKWLWYYNPNFPVKAYVIEVQRVRTCKIEIGLSYSLVQCKFYIHHQNFVFHIILNFMVR